MGNSYHDVCATTKVMGSNPLPTTAKPEPPPNPPYCYPPRCNYDPREHGLAPVGYFTCPQCGAKSYWKPSREPTP
jgi:hypothetical protein